MKMPKKRKDREALIKQIAREKGLSGTKLNQFMAQVKKETGNFTKFEESARYSVKRMREIFRKVRQLKNGTFINPKDVSKYKSEDFKLTDEDLKKISPLYKGKGGSKEKFFNFFYSNRKNLKTGPKEGSKYYGRGPIQLTGKDNYKRYKADPAKMDDLKYATEKSVDYFKNVTKNVPNTEKDTDKYTKIVNVNTDDKSYAERRKYFKEYEEKQKKLDIRQAEGTAAFGNTESFKKLMEKRKEEEEEEELVGVDFVTKHAADYANFKENYKNLKEMRKKFRDLNDQDKELVYQDFIKEDMELAKKVNNRLSSAYTDKLPKRSPSDYDKKATFDYIDKVYGESRRKDAEELYLPKNFIKDRIKMEEEEENITIMEALLNKSRKE